MLLRRALFIVLPLALSGCISIENQVQPIDVSVRPLASGSDCTPMILGFGYGVNTVEQAKANGRIPGDPPKGKKSAAPYSYVSAPIVRLHSVSYYHGLWPFFGMDCIEVTGEPETAPAPVK